jgi:hypothetical protein
MFITRVSTMSVFATSGTLIVIGPSPRIWCSAGTGLFSHGWRLLAVVGDEAEPLALGVFEVEHRSAVEVCDLAVRYAQFVNRPRQYRSESALPTRKPVRTMLCVPRRSRGRGQSEERDV